MIISRYSELPTPLGYCLYVAGYSGLCLAAVTLIAIKGGALGWVYWFAGLTVIAMIQTLLLSYQPRLILIVIPVGIIVLPILVFLKL